MLPYISFISVVVLVLSFKGSRKIGRLLLVEVNQIEDFVGPER